MQSIIGFQPVRLKGITVASDPSAKPGHASAQNAGSQGIVARWLEHKIWVGLAGILAAIGVVIALVAYCVPPDEATPAPINQISGDCNAQGTGNSINCNRARPYP